MKICRILSLAALAIFGCCVLRAEETSTLSMTSDISYSSAYVYRGIKRTDGAVQPSLEVDYGTFDAGIWASQPIKDKRSPFSTEIEGNEVDLYGGYKYKITDAFSIDAATTLYWYPNAKRTMNGVPVNQTDYSYEAGLGGTYRLRGISPSVFFYYDFIRQAQTVEGAIDYSIPLQTVGTELEMRTYGGTQSAMDAFPRVPGGHIHESYNYYGAQMTVPYRVSPNAKVHLGVRYEGNDKYLVGVPRNHVWFVVGFSAGF